MADKLRFHIPIAVAANGKTIAAFGNEQDAEAWARLRSDQHPGIHYSIYDLREPRRAAKVIVKEADHG